MQSFDSVYRVEGMREFVRGISPNPLESLNIKKIDDSKRRYFGISNVFNSLRGKS